MLDDRAGTGHQSIATLVVLSMPYFTCFTHALCIKYSVMKVLKLNEPSKKLLTQMVLKNGVNVKIQSNIVSPHSLPAICANTIRFFIIFTAPPEQDLSVRLWWKAHTAFEETMALSQQAADVVIPLNENKASEVKEFDSPEQKANIAK